jgi:hypothetical protein
MYILQFSLWALAQNERGFKIPLVACVFLSLYIPLYVMVWDIFYMCVYIYMILFSWRGFFVPLLFGLIVDLSGSSLRNRKLVPNRAVPDSGAFWIWWKIFLNYFDQDFLVFKTGVGEAIKVDMINILFPYIILSRSMSGRCISI